MIFDVIKKIAKERGMSIYQLEKENGLSNGSISKWNKATPSADSLNKVSKSLGTTSDYIFNEAEKEVEA